MSYLQIADNSLDKVEFRQRVREFNEALVKGNESGQFRSTESEWDVKQCFAPVDGKYGQGLYLYGRSMFIPKDSWLVGKIHRYPCINFVLKGKIAVGFDAQGAHLEAPAMFVSGAGVQKVGYALEDTVWATAHLVEGCDESRVEDELIAKTYQELGLLDSVDDLLKIEVSK